MEYLTYATENPITCFWIYLSAMLSIGFIKSLYVYFRYFFGRFADHPFYIIPMITSEFFFSPYILIWGLLTSLASKRNIKSETVNVKNPEVGKPPLDEDKEGNADYGNNTDIPSDRQNKIAFYTELLNGFDNPDERQVINDYIKTL